MTYYYFITSMQKIVGFKTELDPEANPRFIALSPEQVVFMSEHPTAKYWEVWRCSMDGDPEPTPEPQPDPETTLEMLKANTKQNLSHLSLQTLDRYVKSYQLANAQTSLYELEMNPEAQTIYDSTRAHEIINTFNAVGKELRGYYKTAESEIDTCETSEAVEERRAYYENIYDNYEYNSNTQTES